MIGYNVMLVPMINFLYLYISTFRGMCAVPWCRAFQVRCSVIIIIIIVIITIAIP